jgi:hypothetical protein
MSFSKSSTTYQTECVSIQTDGYITIKIWDTKSGKSYTLEQSKKDAIRALLFLGISGNNGCTTQEPILKNAQDIANFQKFENDFFSKDGRWLLLSSRYAYEISLPEGISEKNCKAYQVTISINGLKHYLKEHKIIK